MLARSLAIAALVIATSASADAPSAPSAASGKLIVGIPDLQTAPPPPPAAKDKLICRSDTTTGSWVKKSRWCATASEWRESERSARQWTDTIQSNKGRYDANGGPPTDAYLSGGRVVMGGH